MGMGIFSLIPWIMLWQQIHFLGQLEETGDVLQQLLSSSSVQERHKLYDRIPENEYMNKWFWLFLPFQWQP